MTFWSLSTTHTIHGTTYELNTDYRDILEIIGYLNNDQEPEYIRWQIAVALFFEQDVPTEHFQEASQYLADFISVGEKYLEKSAQKLLDWDQDAQMIVSGVNRVAGKEIRALKYMHWWTFISLFHEIGEGPFATVVSIRHKRATGKKLEKWELDFYRENRAKVDFCRPEDPDDEEIKAYFDKWL